MKHVCVQSEYFCILKIGFYSVILISSLYFFFFFFTVSIKLCKPSNFFCREHHIIHLNLWIILPLIFMFLLTFFLHFFQIWYKRIWDFLVCVFFVYVRVKCSLTNTSSLLIKNIRENATQIALFSTCKNKKCEIEIETTNNWLYIKSDSKNLVACLVQYSWKIQCLVLSSISL